MKKNCTLALLLVLAMVITCLAGCGSNTAASASAPAEQSASAPAESKAPAAPEAASQVEETSTQEPDSAIAEGPADYTEANANNDYDGWREMLKTLHTELPITEDPVSLTYFLGYETSGLT